MMIPAGKAGLIIGKGGETIKQLQVYTNSQSASPVAREVFHNTLTGVF
jgi:ribosomal protein S3